MLAGKREVTMRRKNRFETYVEAANRGPYDECPMMEIGTDPQLHLSRNDRAQPFFLICEQDSVIAQMSGTARVEFRNSSVNYFDLELGDFVYVPGGTPHRIMPKTESIQLRYKAAEAGLEAVAWYSPKTNEEIARVTWDCASELPQEGYLRACRAFNQDVKMRTCPTTGVVLPPIDLAPFGWEALAKDIRETEAAERARMKEEGNRIPNERGRRPARTRIEAANENKVPRKNNVYEYARTATSTLSPMFPYFDEGSIVPCVTLQDLKGRGNRGYFVHVNTVQEVNVCFGVRGLPYLKPGTAVVGPLTHPVGDKPGQLPDPNTMVLPVITQRQAVGIPQSEAVIFMCDKCGEINFRHEYRAHDFPDTLPGATDPQIIGLPTISQSAASAQLYNESLEHRTCKKCGHVSEPFPAGYWGWQEYRNRTHVAVEARSIMSAAAQAAPQVAAASAAAPTATVANVEVGISADEEFRAVFAVSDLKPGQAKRAKVGDLELAIYNVDGKFYASEGFCTHARVHLGGGYVDGRLIECRMHGGTFDIPTGKAVGDPCTVDLKTYAVKVEGNQIYVGVPRQALAQRSA
jgi:nitrite reductase/ring-hydroxylating ferredoxin subunit/mannose-6-phosphate isomerase-like protein (cupin superfamily)